MPPSPPEIVWQGLSRSYRLLLMVAGVGGLALGLAGLVWVAVARPVPQVALLLAVVGFGLVIQAIGTGPNRVRVARGQPGAPRPVGTRAWYYGLSAALMVLAIVEVGIGLIVLGQPQAVRVLLLTGVGLSAVTAVIAALSAADLTKYVVAAPPEGAKDGPGGRSGGARSSGARPSGGRGGAGAGRRPSKSRGRSRAKRRRR
jgi:hypothetical protein